jgi:hypothetical protein
MMITMISPPLEPLRVDDDVVARTEVPALDGMARDRHICLYYPPSGTVAGGSLGNATLKHRQYPRIKEY